MLYFGRHFVPCCALLFRALFRAVVEFVRLCFATLCVAIFRALCSCSILCGILCSYYLWQCSPVFTHYWCSQSTLFPLLLLLFSDLFFVHFILLISFHCCCSFLSLFHFILQEQQNADEEEEISFVIQSPHERWELQTNSLEEMQEWVEAMTPWNY